MRVYYTKTTCNYENKQTQITETKQFSEFEKRSTMNGFQRTPDFNIQHYQNRKKIIIRWFLKMTCSTSRNNGEMEFVGM